MHPTTAKLISLQQKESFLCAGWPAGLQPKLAQEVAGLRREIEPQFLAHYDGLRDEGKIPVVPVVGGKCQGCQASLSSRFQTDLRDSIELLQCEHCHRFIYPTLTQPEQWTQPELRALT
jgi:hypothetical protein